MFNDPKKKKINAARRKRKAASRQHACDQDRSRKNQLHQQTMNRLEDLIYAASGKTLKECNLRRTPAGAFVLDVGDYKFEAATIEHLSNRMHRIASDRIGGSLTDLFQSLVALPVPVVTITEVTDG